MGFDLHMHILWNLPEATVPDIDRYLSKRYSSVWIDRQAVRQPSRLAHYVARNVFPHEEVLDWPEAALTAAWDDTYGAKLIRRAGLFLKPVEGASGLAEGDHDDGECRNTVRQPSPESQSILTRVLVTQNGSRWPTLGETALVLHFLNKAGDRDHPVDVLPGVCGIPFEAFVEAVQAMEDVFEEELFDRKDWSPTRAGLTLGKRGHPLVKLMARAYDQRQKKPARANTSRGRVPYT